MYSMEFMVLYLAEIIVAALVILVSYLLIRLVGIAVNWIRKIIMKGVKDYDRRKDN